MNGHLTSSVDAVDNLGRQLGFGWSDGAVRLERSDTEPVFWGMGAALTLSDRTTPVVEVGRPVDMASFIVEV